MNCLASTFVSGALVGFGAGCVMRPGSSGEAPPSGVTCFVATQPAEKAR